MARNCVIAIVGAESTGKTTLAQQLAARLADEGRDTIVVAEYLREWCDDRRRTPRAHEQAAIAREQTSRIDAAARAHEVVVADTTALMTAIYSELLFADQSLYVEALAAQRRCDLTLVTALDLPWHADGHQRDGEHVREPVDALLRSSLTRARVGYSVVGGKGEQRVEAAMPRSAGGAPAAQYQRHLAMDLRTLRRWLLRAPPLRVTEPSMSRAAGCAAA